MKRLLCSGLTALVISLLLLAASLSYAQATEKKKVLILNSYHIGYKWTDNIVKAIEHVLSDKSISLYIEYMDTKRISDERYFQQLHEIYKLKYDKVKFDVIISSDDDAFNFLRKYRDDIFPDTPVVFCGVNWFKESDLKGHKLFTGVNETPDLRAGFETILNLQPDTKQIVIINDTTTTGLKIHTELLRIIQDFQNAVKFVLLEDIEMTKLQKEVQRLTANTVVFYTLFLRDKSGKWFEYDESISLISSKCKVPVYCTWDFSLGYGTMGGMLTSGFYQGETAAQLALQILDGENVYNIPVVMKSPNRYMFDYKQLQRFGLKLSDLPKIYPKTLSSLMDLIHFIP